MVTLGNELPRVFVVLVPSLLRRVERTRVGIALRLEIEDGVECIRTVLCSGHDCVLVGTDY